MDRIPTIQYPRLFDKVIVEVQKALADNLPWLDHSFGRAERLVKVINGKKYYSPNVYIGRNEYRLITPDDAVGNYSFFVLGEPQNVEYYPGMQNSLTTNFSLIVWLDMRRVETYDERNTEAVKRDILRVLNGGVHLRTGSVSINTIYERAENVFKEYTLDEIDNQYIMHPFAAFRFEGTIKVEDDCV